VCVYAGAQFPEGTLPLWWLSALVSPVDAVTVCQDCIGLRTAREHFLTCVRAPGIPRGDFEPLVAGQSAAPNPAPPATARWTWGSGLHNQE
jgi:hypothetical protein